VPHTEVHQRLKINDYRHIWSKNVVSRVTLEALGRLLRTCGAGAAAVGPGAVAGAPGTVTGAPAADATLLLGLKTPEPRGVSGST